MENPAPSPAAVPAALSPVGDLLSSGANVTLENAGALLGVWAACHLPAQALGFVVGMTTGLVDKASLQTSLETHDFGRLAALAAVGLFGMALGMLGYATSILLAARALRGQAVVLGDLLVEGVGRTISVMFASLVVGVCVGLGAMALILPGLYLLLRLFLTVTATCVDGLGPLSAFGRSWALTRGRLRGSAAFLGALFVIGLLTGAALIAASLVLRMIGGVAGPAGGALAGLVVNLFQFMVSAWGAACMTKFYLELADLPPPA